MSTAAAIDELACIKQQPGQNLLIYINKYRDLHWWCTKKLLHEETYKVTLSQFCSSLQDPIGRKLCEKLWDDRDNRKLVNLQKCFDEAIHSYKRYRVTEHHCELEVYESTVEINETLYQPKSNYSGNNKVSTKIKITRVTRTTNSTVERNHSAAPVYSVTFALDPGKSPRFTVF